MEPLERLTAALAGRYRIERQLGQGGMAGITGPGGKCRAPPVSSPLLRHVGLHSINTDPTVTAEEDEESLSRVDARLELLSRPGRPPDA